ncbi:uncharacterized protein JCM6883_000907 [Sporobolomyces salmoneus]|uniref:uncharacterized protein n=1 Tax=Sporobolomyces salmoneus TaxID=183962 RepID=UPI0031788ED2
MPIAQDTFSLRCPDLTFSAYCSAPWQVSLDQTCCGICPSPAINAYGTLGGLILASFFDLLIVLFRPAASAVYICGQLMLGNMFIVAILVRNLMGSASNGVNAVQKWHAEFAFLLASSTSALIVACLLSDVHFIHGFGSHEQLHDFQLQKASFKRDKRSPSAHLLLGGPSHPLFRQPRDTLWQRFRKFCSRRQAVLLFSIFTTTQLFWFIVYATTIWWGDRTTFWQPQCDDLIGRENYALLEGVSFTFASIALVSSLLLAIPVFASISASEFLVRIFHLQGRHSSTTDSALRLRLKVQNHIKRGKLHPPLKLIHVETKMEKKVKTVLSLAIWLFWFNSLLVIFFRALEEFLLIGIAWPYAGIQNFLFGCFPLVKFFLDPFRAYLRARRKRKQATAPVAEHGSGRPIPSTPRTSRRSEESEDFERSSVRERRRSSLRR